MLPKQQKLNIRHCNRSAEHSLGITDPACRLVAYIYHLAVSAPLFSPCTAQHSSGFALIINVTFSGRERQCILRHLYRLLFRIYELFKVVKYCFFSILRSFFTHTLSVSHPYAGHNPPSKPITLGLSTGRDDKQDQVPQTRDTAD